MPRYYYCYMMDTEKLVRLALSDPRLHEEARRQGLYKYLDVLVSSGVERIRRNAKIPELVVGTVWFGSGHLASCWSLPWRMFPQHRTEEGARQLCAFKELIGAEGEPLWLPSASLGRGNSQKNKEPDLYKTLQPPQSLIDQSLLSFHERVRAGEITLDKLLEPLGDLPDMQGLSLKEGGRNFESQDTTGQSHLREVQAP